MSGYNEFKNDAKRWGWAFLFTSIIFGVFKVIQYIICFGAVKAVSYNREEKEKNDNYYKL